jgi:tetratricopeptide (TPR) repeat protein
MSEGEARYQKLLHETDAAVRAGQKAPAAGLAEQALACGPEHPALLNLVAFRRMGERRPQEAVPLLERARGLAPRDVNILNSLGIALTQVGQLKEAIAVFEAANLAAPDYAPAYHNKASALEQSGEVTAARAQYEAAVARNPNYAEALARLAFIAATQGEGARARELGERALAAGPAQSSAVLAIALADLADGALDAARAGAQTVLDGPAEMPRSRAIALGILGDVEDRLDRPKNAFAHYRAAKAEIADLYGASFGGSGAPTYVEHVERLIDYFRAADEALWRLAAPGAQPAPARAHVFLLGFPRSGTTLLEQALAGHSDVVTMEEKSVLEDAAGAFLASGEGLDRLATIAESDAAECRANYWATCRRHVPALAQRVFVDKLPLNTINLGAIAKLFPQAKILFALRDPRDVVLSCFRQRFGLNAAMHEFATPESTARLYDAVMRLATICREKLALNLLETRYEDLVADFDAQIARICSSFEIAPEAGMRDVGARARERVINTPSASQIAQGLYQGGAGQWRRYREELEPLLPILEPWVLRFGYKVD